MNRKHKGIGLPLGLFVALTGLFIVALMFASVTDFFHIFSGYRREYTDYVTASSYIERLKAHIVSFNNSDGTTQVLHGQGYPNKDALIENLDDLLVISGDTFTIDEIVTANGRQWVEARVYDASYNPGNLASAFVESADFKDAPSSFYYLGKGNPNPWETIEVEGSETEPDIEAIMHRRHGAYLIRVRLYPRRPDEDDEPDKNVVSPDRTTEEAFRMFIP